MPSNSQTGMVPFTAWALAFLYLIVTKGLWLGLVYNVYNLNYIYPMLNIIPQLSETQAKRKSIADSIPDRLYPRLDLDVSRSKCLLSSWDPSMNLIAACTILPQLTALTTPSDLLSLHLLLPGQVTEDRQLLSLLGYRGVAAGASYHFCYMAVLLAGEARFPMEHECRNMKDVELQN